MCTVFANDLKNDLKIILNQRCLHSLTTTIQPTVNYLYKWSQIWFDSKISKIKLNVFCLHTEIPWQQQFSPLYLVLAAITLGQICFSYFVVGLFYTQADNNIFLKVYFFDHENLQIAVNEWFAWMEYYSCKCEWPWCYSGVTCSNRPLPISSHWSIFTGIIYKDNKHWAEIQTICKTIDSRLNLFKEWKKQIFWTDMLER